MNNTVIFVDDNQPFGLMMKALLTAKGFKVLYAADLGHAKRLMKVETTPDVIVLDYSLKEGTTEEFAKELRALMPAVVIIMATGEVIQLNHIKGLVNEGILTAFIKKPYGADDLSVLISGLENAAP